MSQKCNANIPVMGAGIDSLHCMRGGDPNSDAWLGALTRGPMSVDWPTSWDVSSCVAQRCNTYLVI